MINCYINIEQTSHSAVYSGSVITGEVVITLGNLLNVRGIALIIDGIAHVEWTQNVVTYKDDKDYIHEVTYLWGSSNGAAITLDGTLRNTFSILLPQNLPSSIESKYGHIRYTAKVVIHRPWNFDKTFEVPFTILNQTDLNNEDPQKKLPLILKVEKTFLCSFFSIKSLIVEASTPQTVFFSGQFLPLTINLYNESRTNIYSIDVTLKQIIKCTSHSPSTKTELETTSVANIVLDSIKNVPKQSLNVDLFIPVLPSTTSKLTTRLIDVNYKLRVKTNLSSAYTSPIITIPIFIGNIPFNNIQNLTFQNRNNPNP